MSTREGIWGREGGDELNSTAFINMSSGSYSGLFSLLKQDFGETAADW